MNAQRIAWFVVLAARFARGEIDAEEYRQHLDVLHAGLGSRAA